MDDVRERPLDVPHARALVERELAVNFPKCTLYRMIRDGRIDSMRLGNRILIPAAALREFLQRCLDGERY